MNDYLYDHGNRRQLPYELIKMKYGEMIADTCVSYADKKELYSEKLKGIMIAMHKNEFSITFVEKCFRNNLDPLIENSKKMKGDYHAKCVVDPIQDKIALDKMAQRHDDDYNDPLAGVEKPRKKYYPSNKAPLLGLENKFIQDGDFFGKLGTFGEVKTYMFLNSYLIKGELVNDPFNLYQGYFIERKLLAASVAYPMMLERTHLAPGTLSSAIKKLKKSGIIKVEKAPFQSKGKYPQNIYILGYHVGEGKDRLYHYYIMD